MIAVYMDDVQDSPIVPEKPAFDFYYKYNQTLEVDSDLLYTGTIFFGNSFDGSSKMLYDTSSRLTIIPKKGTGPGWFDLTDAANVTVDTGVAFDLEILGQPFTCEPAYGALCGKSDNYEISVDNDCAYTVVCLVEAESIPNGYEGVVGLGKWTPMDSDSNYLIELYIQQQLEPALHFDYNFED